MLLVVNVAVAEPLPPSRGRSVTEAAVGLAGDGHHRVHRGEGGRTLLGLDAVEGPGILPSRVVEGGQGNARGLVPVHVFGDIAERKTRVGEEGLVDHVFHKVLHCVVGIGSGSTGHLLLLGGKHAVAQIETFHVRHRQTQVVNVCRQGRIEGRQYAGRVEGIVGLAGDVPEIGLEDIAANQAGVDRTGAR